MEIAQVILLSVMATCALAGMIVYIVNSRSLSQQHDVTNYLLGQMYIALLAYDESYDGWNDDSDDEDAPFGPQGDDEREAARWN